MFTKPARILAIAISIAMLVAVSADATRLDYVSLEATSPTAGQMVRLPGHVLPALAKATRIKSAPNAGDSPITLTLTLNHDDEAGFIRYLRDVYDPASPNFLHFLTQEELVARFGPSQQSYDDLLAYLQDNGFELVEGSANRMTLMVRGTRTDAERAFDVGIEDYQLDGRRFFANAVDPGLPARLAIHVEAVTGLSDLADMSHIDSKWPDPSKVAQNALIAGDTVFLGAVLLEGGALLLPALPALLVLIAIICVLALIFAPYDNSSSGSLVKGDRPEAAAAPGAGETIGLVEFDTFQQSDVQDYLGLFSQYAGLIGLPVGDISNVTSVHVNGGATPGPNQDEVLLDIDTVLDIAPGAKVVVYDGPFQGPETSFQPIVNQMINDKVNIISNSWTYCEDQTSEADVDSIDTLFMQAAAAGITVVNGSGDQGSTCLDGSPNTIGVPADSPHATAVGGSTLSFGNAQTYGSETWWDGSTSTPPTGQGGFGVSQFFSSPSYQSGLNTSTMRSVPDVVVNADPSRGTMICQASNGGCPSNLLYGGTSMAAPIWAAFTAQLNQSAGKQLGFLNPLIYPFANTTAFHNAASMGSDFAHVGLGSPVLNPLLLSLTGQSVGAVSASVSLVLPYVYPLSVVPPVGVPDDGATKAYVKVELRDANGNSVSGKTVQIAANSGSSADISPASAVTSADNGAAVFAITDSKAENVTFTAMDTKDGITLSQTAEIPFVPPAAAGGSIIASLGTEPANGTTADTITVTLEDSLSRPTPGKLVTLSQGSGESAIAAPSPPVTNSSGQIAFKVTDLVTETNTYTATDVTDGNLLVPGSAQIDFTNGPGNCPPGLLQGAANPANGYLATTFASGFTVSAGNQGFSYNCFGAYGMAWDASGNLYVTDWPTGNIYKFGSSGGVADSGTLFTTVSAPATGLAIDPAGNMFASEGSVSGYNGAIVPVDLATGTVGTAIASGFPCLGNMALDPAIPALYVDDFCSFGPVSPNIWQITGIDGASPTTTVYAQVPGNVENFNLAVAPDGTIYDSFATATGAPIARITPGSPPTVTLLTAADGSPISLSGGLGMTVGGKQASGDAQFVIAPFDAAADGLGGPSDAVRTVDVTGAAAVPALQLTTSDFSGLSNFAIGPDGCLYVAGGPTVSRVTKADGTCPFGPTTQPPALSLTPTTASPTQGGSQNLTATFHYGSVPAGTPVTLEVGGNNVQVRMADTDANGQASFSYTGTVAGVDDVIAQSTVNSALVQSNPVEVTWESGPDVTFLTLNLSPKNATPGNPVNLVASLSDISKNPAVPVVGQTVTLGLGNQTCGGSTNASGNANCQVNPEIIPGNPSRPITASFAGTADLTAANASTGFMFTAPPEDAKLTVTPKTLHFPATIELGGVGAVSKPLLVTVFNPKNKKQKLTVTFLGADNTGDFTILGVAPTTCDVTLMPKQRCKIAVTFSPTATGTRSGTLMIVDNAELNNQQMVKLKGEGEQGKLGYSPASLSFGKQAIDTTSNTKTVKIENRNPVAMTFAASISGDYQIASNTCAAMLPAKSTCEIGVTFEPTATGSQPGTLTFTDDAAKSPQKVKLTGEGK